MSPLAKLPILALIGYQIGRNHHARDEWLDRARAYPKASEQRCTCLKFAREYHRAFMDALREART